MAKTHIGRRVWVVAVLVTLATGITSRASAQAVPCKALPAHIKVEAGRFAQDYVTNTDQLTADAHLPDLAALAAVHALSLGELKDALYVPVETSDANKQTGGSPRLGGVASLVEKPNFATLLALAVESGAVAIDGSDTQLTLSSSVYALAAAFNGDSSRTYQHAGWLTAIAFSASFDPSPDTQNPLASVRRDQLRQWGFKLRLTPDRSVRSSHFERWWQENIRSVMVRQNEGINGLHVLLMSDRTYRAAFNEMRVEVDRNLRGAIATGAPEVERLLSCAVQNKLIEPIESGAIQVSPAIVATLRTKIVPTLVTGSEEMARINDMIREHLESIAGRPTASFTSRWFRPVAGHDFWEGNFAYSQKLAPLTAILNVGGSYYMARPGEAAPLKGWRDVVVVGSLQHATRSPFLRETADLSPITIALSAAYEKVFDYRSTNPTAIGFEKTLVQARVELPLTLGIILPMSFSLSNDPELIDETKEGSWSKGVYFGLTFDLDKFTALTKALVASRR